MTAESNSPMPSFDLLLQSFQTVGLMAAVPDDSSDRVRRIRTVSGEAS
jgi:hypothetical protein